MVDDSFTKSLLHFNGADAATTFTDESGKTWSASGNAQLDTAQSKFGTASGLFDGTGDYITTPDHADWDLGDIWTVDFWVRFADKTGVQTFAQQFQDGTHFWTLQKDADDKLRIRFFNGGETGQYVTTAAPTINDDTWYHAMFGRNSGDEYIFLDGTSLSLTEANAWSTNPTYAGQLNVGRNEDLAGNYLNGWMDEFRLSNGIIRNISNFTPRTTEYDSPANGNFLAFM